MGGGRTEVPGMVGFRNWTEQKFRERIHSIEDLGGAREDWWIPLPISQSSSEGLSWILGE